MIAALLLVGLVYSLDVKLPLHDYFYSLNLKDLALNHVNAFCPQLSSLQVTHVSVPPSTPSTVTTATVYSSMWIKPPGFMRFYQSTTTFSIGSAVITYGSLSAATSSVTVAKSENWINVIFKTKLTGTSCLFETFYIRQIGSDELWDNTAAKEILYFFVDKSGLRISETTPTPFQVTVDVNPNGQIYLSPDDLEISYLQMLGTVYNVFSTVFEGDYMIEDASLTADDRKLLFDMVVLGRPKPLSLIPTFNFYLQALDFFQDEPYDISNYIDNVFKVDYFGYNIYQDKKAKFKHLEFNNRGFNNMMTFELKALAIPFDQDRELTIKIEIFDTSAPSTDSLMNSVKIVIKRSSPGVLSFDLLKTVSTEFRLVTFTMQYNTGISEDLSIVYMEGYGLKYSDKTKAVTEVTIGLSASAGSENYINSGYYTEEISTFLHHTTPDQKSLMSTFEANCVGCVDAASDEFSVRLLNYQLLLGVFSPTHLRTTIEVTMNVISPLITGICAMVLNNGNYLVQTTATPTFNLYYCSRTFMYPKTEEIAYRTNQIGLLSNPTLPCLVADLTGRCLVCSSGYLTEFSGTDATGCLLESSCALKDSMGAYQRYLATWTLSNNVARKICHSALSGCQSSAVPLTCDMCDEYKKHTKNAQCECSIENCDPTGCENSPCEKCIADYGAVFIDRDTDRFKCVQNNGCNQTYGKVITPTIGGQSVTVTTPWCKQCDDANCADCANDYTVCTSCLDRHFLNASTKCEKCLDSCLRCDLTSVNCIACEDGKVLINLNSIGVCSDVLSMNRSYFVVSVSTAYIKFNNQLNPDIKLENFDFHIFKSNELYKSFVSTAVLVPDSTVPVVVKEFKILKSHMIIKLDIKVTTVDNGVLVLDVKDKQQLNDSSVTRFYSDSYVVVEEIDYFRSSTTFENYLGIFFGIVLGLTGLASLFIPAVKYTIMSMKIFQMNNYFFLLNINLPYNLYLFFDNIQFGNIIRLAVAVNPLNFLTNNRCKEFEDKLLTLNKTCQLFDNAGPHFLWFGLSGLIKLGLELYQKSLEKRGEKRGKLYEFLKLKFGRRYFIELLNYFHMDLVLYNLMNLMFTEMSGFLSFINLFVSVLLMVFFIYFYIALFVIIAENTKDFLLNNLCDPEGKLNKVGTSEIKKKKSTAGNNLLSTSKVPPQPQNHASADMPPPTTQRGQEGKPLEKWSVLRVYEEMKAKKLKELEEQEDSVGEENKKSAPVVGENAKEEEPTYLPSSIYRFLFINSHCMNVYSKQYYAITLVKEFSLAMVLVMASASGLFQIIFFFIIFVLVFYYNLTCAPLQNQNNNKILRFYSLTYVFMSFMTLVLAISGSSVTPSINHFFFGYCLMLFEIIIICLMVTMVVLEFLKKRADRKALEKERELLARGQKTMYGMDQKEDVDNSQQKIFEPPGEGEQESLEKGREESNMGIEEEVPDRTSHQKQSQAPASKLKTNHKSHQLKKKDTVSSFDSFKQIELGLMKGAKTDGGVFFENKFSTNEQRDQSMRSIVSSKQPPSSNLQSVAGEPPSKKKVIKKTDLSRLKKVQPKRVESFSDNISIEQ